MRQLPPRRPKDGPLSLAEWLVLVTLGLEALFLLYVMGGFRPLGG